MASKEKNKKKKKLNKGKIIFVLIILIMLAVLGFYLYTSVFKKVSVSTKKVKITDEIKEFGYVLEDNETDLYKDYFKQLSKTLSSDDEEDIDYDKYAELVVKLFVSDFYNLDNKVTKNDVGGLQFIHDDAKENFLLKAKYTMYKNIENNVYNDRKQELPIVTEVELDSIDTTKFTYNNTDYDAYKVTVSWKYKKDLGYDDDKIYTLIKVDKKLCIVESNPISSNSKTNK